MLLLTTTSDIVRVVTDAGVTVDVHASFVDLSSGTATPGSQNTAITTATTTTVVAAPGASTSRNVKTLVVRNKHAATSVGVTVQLYNGATAYELHAANLGPGQTISFTDGRWFVESSAVTPSRAWETQIISSIGADKCNPGNALLHMQRAGNIAATPTNISTSIARCSLFRPPRDITVQSIRYYGVGATTNVYRIAVYRYSDLARLTAELAFTTALSTWAQAGASLGLALTGGVTYFLACSVNATGTTPGIGCVGGTVAATTGQIIASPGSLPGSLDCGVGYTDGYFFQFAVTTGALPDPAPALAAQAAWTGGMPTFFLDAA